MKGVPPGCSSPLEPGGAGHTSEREDGEDGDERAEGETLSLWDIELNVIALL